MHGNSFLHIHFLTEHLMQLLFHARSIPCTQQGHPSLFVASIFLSSYVNVLGTWLIFLVEFWERPDRDRKCAWDEVAGSWHTIDAWCVIMPGRPGGSIQTSQVQHMDIQVSCLGSIKLPHPFVCSLLCVDAFRLWEASLHLPYYTAIQNIVYKRCRWAHSSHKCSGNTTVSQSNVGKQEPLIWVLLFWSNRIHKSPLAPSGGYRPKDSHMQTCLIPVLKNSKGMCISSKCFTTASSQTPAMSWKCIRVPKIQAKLAKLQIKLLPSGRNFSLFVSFTVFHPMPFSILGRLQNAVWAMCMSNAFTPVILMI